MSTTAGEVPGEALPSLSIIVAAWNGADALRACLDGLGGGLPDLEIIVARSDDQGQAALLATHYPAVRDVPCPPGTTVPKLRLAGLHRATGDIVAFLEDQAIPAAGWARAIRLAHLSGEAGAVGGPVDQAPDQSVVSWAVWLYDYGRYMPPCSAGAVTALSGMNVSYRRAALEAWKDLLHGGFHEAPLHAAMQAAGLTLQMAPTAIVLHRKAHELGPAIRTAFHLARGYASRRVAGTGGFRRARFGLLSLALPVVLTARTLMSVLPKGRHRGPIVVALVPYLFLNLAWSVGEFAGYVAGAGDSERHWS